MTTDVDTPQDTHALLAAPAAAAGELERSAPDYHAIVSWLSRHAAALEHAVYPVARRELPTAAVTRQVDMTRRLEHVLLSLHQTLNGDGRGNTLEIVHLSARLADVLGKHIEGTRLLLGQLTEVLSEQNWSAVVSRHDAALRDAPSRPHPHTPHGRMGERVAFPIAGAVDRLLDALDSRAVPPLPVQRAESGLI